MQVTKKLFVTTAALVTAAGSAGAQITVDNFDSWNGGSNMSQLEMNWDASASDKLVIIVTGEHGFNQTANGSTGDVFYDGVQLTAVERREPIKADAGPPVVLVDDNYNSLYYLDNPGSVFTAGLITTSGFSSRGNMAVIALSGTADGVGNSVTSVRDTNTADLTTSAGSIVIGSYGLGGTGNTAQLNTVTTPSWDAETARQENGNNWDGHVVAYQNGVSAGLASYTFDDTKVPEADGRTGRNVILAEFLLAGGGFDPADLDQDGDVDDADFGIAFAAFTGPGGGPSSNPDADLDNDGDVDDADFGIAFAAFTGPGGVPAAAVPEPASLALLGLGGLLIARRRRA